MKYLKFAGLLSGGLLALLGNVSYGQYVLSGNTPQGGNVIVGSGPLGALSQATTPALSASGFDQVTLSLGSMATGVSTDTILFATSGDTLLNNGTVTGVGLSNAVSFISTAVLGGEAITNNGMILGGTATSGLNGIGASAGGNPGGTSGGNLGGGVDVAAGGGLSSVSLTNNGTISGNLAFINGITVNGGGNSGAGTDVGGNVASGVDIESGGALSGVTLMNQGTITSTFGEVNGITVQAGGNSGSGINVGGNVGDGVDIASGGALSGVSLVNQGTIAGSGSLVNGITVRDGGNSGSGVDVGGNLGVGVNVASGGALSGVSLVNRGSITGGGFTGIGGIGVQAGGNSGAGTNIGGEVSSGVAILSAGAMSNVSLVNYGVITGGTVGTAFGGGVGGNTGGGTDVGGSVASGIDIQSGGAGSNLVITNFGAITGGATGNLNAGAGISANTSNLTINNWGVITAGAGPSGATQAGYPAVAISLQGSNNTVNLNGHSSVNGTIQNTGANSVLNLNFTGVNPQALASLKAQLAGQGWPGSNNFTGSFTLRGVTYYVDPIPLNLQGITSYEGQAKTPNQFAIGSVFDSLTYNPALGSPLLTLLNAIDQSGNVPQALEELSPQKFEIYGELAIANATQMSLEIDQRLNNLRDGSESIDTTGMGGGITSTGDDQTTTAGFSKDDSKDNKNVVQTAAPEKRWGFFAAGDGLLFRGNSKNVDLQEGRSDNAGTIAGVDGKVGEHAVIGALFAYNNADATLGSDNSHAVIESYSGGIYGSYHQDGYYVNSLAAYTRNDYNNTRNILFPGFGAGATSSTSGDQESVNIDGGYDWHATDRVTLGPIAGVQYTHVGVNGFNEGGASAATLAVGSQTVESLQSRVGFRADYHVQVKQDVAFATELSAAWQHEYLDSSRGIGADFITTGLAPFSVQTASPQRDAGIVSLGVNFTFHNKLTLFADYSLLMWSASYYEQTLNGGLRISF